MIDIEYYQTPTGNIPLEKFLEKLIKKNKLKDIGKIQLYIKQLGLYGLDINNKFNPKAMKHLRGKIYELCPGDNRILFFFHDGNKYVLLHGFTKKTRTTPKNEIDKAEKEMKNYITNIK